MPTPTTSAPPAGAWRSTVIRTSHGGDAEAMRRLNEAADIVLARARRQPAADVGGGVAATAQRSGGDRRAPAVSTTTSRRSSIEALPVVAFEALVVVTSWIGEVVVDEPPYQLDVLVLDPLRCWCRLDLVPDAGASTVSLTIAALPDEALPDIDDVRDLWVASLNRLGR